jgi:hypothetical protein
VRLAVHVEPSGPAGTADKVVVLGRGSDGKVVNMDVISVIAKIADRTHRAAIELSEAGDARGGQDGGPDGGPVGPLRLPPWLAAVIGDRFDTLLPALAGMASERPDSPSGALLDANIPAVTLTFRKAPGTGSALGLTDAPEVPMHCDLGAAGGSNRQQYGCHTAHATLLRLLEGIHRASNNLCEEVHQSFFFYLMTARARYVSISMYVPAAALVLTALAAKSYYHRFDPPAGDSAGFALVATIAAIGAGVGIFAVLGAIVALRGGAQGGWTFAFGIFFFLFFPLNFLKFCFVPNSIFFFLFSFVYGVPADLTQIAIDWTCAAAVILAAFWLAWFPVSESVWSAASASSRDDVPIARRSKKRSSQDSSAGESASEDAVETEREAREHDGCVAVRWNSLLSFACAYATMGIAVFALVNFAFGYLWMWVVSLSVLAIYPDHARSRRAQALVLALTSPPVSIAIETWATGASGLGVIEQRIARHLTRNTLSLPFLCIVHTPVWLLAARSFALGRPARPATTAPLPSGKARYAK